MYNVVPMEISNLRQIIAHFLNRRTPEYDGDWKVGRVEFIVRCWFGLNLCRQRQFQKHALIEQQDIRDKIKTLRTVSTSLSHKFRVAPTCDRRTNYSSLRSRVGATPACETTYATQYNRS